MLEDQSADSWLRHQPCNAKTSRDNGYDQQHELIPGRRGLRSLVKSVERSSETSTSTYNLALHTVFCLLPGGHFTPHMTARDLAMERSMERTALLQEQGLRSGRDGCTSGQRGGRQCEAKNTKRGYCSSAHVCTVTVRHALPSRFMNVYSIGCAYLAAMYQFVCTGCIVVWTCDSCGTYGRFYDSCSPHGSPPLFFSIVSSWL